MAEVNDQDKIEQERFDKGFDAMAEQVHKLAREKGFWDESRNLCQGLAAVSEGSGLYGLRHFAERLVISQKLKLIGDELAEAHEALRSGNPWSVKAEGYTQIEEELADAVIRIMDLGEEFHWDVAGAILAKHRHNQGRPHKHGRAF